MADNTSLNSGVGGDVLRTEDVGGGIKIPVSKIHTGASGVDGGAVTSANPFPTLTQSGSLTALLVGGGTNPVAFGNPLPISGSVGLTAGGVNVSRTTPLSVEVTAAASGQMLSGSTVRVVNRLNADVTVSGSTQLVAPQGAGNMIRVLSVHAISNGTVMTKWQTTGSSGATGISGYVPLTTLGGVVLPYNPHGWFQTNSNEGLNITLDTPGVNVGISLTWMLA